MINTSQLIYIGKISKTTGIKGSVKVFSLTDFPERFEKTDYVYLVDERKHELVKNQFNDSYKFNISDVEFMQGFIKLTFADYDDINDSEKLKGLLIGVEEEKRVKLPAGQFYFYDIIGCHVFDKNRFIGKVTSVDNYGSSDLLIVRGIEKKELLVPLLKEFVKKIDTVNKRIDVELIDGFTDEDEV